MERLKVNGPLWLVFVEAMLGTVAGRCAFDAPLSPAPLRILALVGALLLLHLLWRYLIRRTPLVVTACFAGTVIGQAILSRG